MASGPLPPLMQPHLACHGQFLLPESPPPPLPLSLPLPPRYPYLQRSQSDGIRISTFPLHFCRGADRFRHESRPLNPLHVSKFCCVQLHLHPHPHPTSTTASTITMVPHRKGVARRTQTFRTSEHTRTSLSRDVGRRNCSGTDNVTTVGRHYRITPLTFLLSFSFLHSPEHLPWCSCLGTNSAAWLCSRWWG
jgi:hypothetical protein